MPEMHLHRTGQTISLSGEQVAARDKIYAGANRGATPVNVFNDSRIVRN